GASSRAKLRLVRGRKWVHTVSMNMQVNREALGAFCRERGIARLELFGSALRDDFREDSDVDLLATFRPDAHPTLFDWADMQEKLAEVFGRPVDLVSRRAIERSKNWIRRQSILSHTMPLYEE
ncbi:MAG: nucleotidyltransferase domain-containing protein, partial [Verrucomicrobiota bacterium]